MGSGPVWETGRPTYIPAVAENYMGRLGSPRLAPARPSKDAINRQSGSASSGPHCWPPQVRSLLARSGPRVQASQIRGSDERVYQPRGRDRGALMENLLRQVTIPTSGAGHGGDVVLMTPYYARALDARATNRPARGTNRDIASAPTRSGTAPRLKLTSGSSAKITAVGTCSGFRGRGKAPCLSGPPPARRNGLSIGLSGHQTRPVSWFWRDEVVSWHAVSAGRSGALRDQELGRLNGGECSGERKIAPGAVGHQGT